LSVDRYRNTGQQVPYWVPLPPGQGKDLPRVSRAVDHTHRQNPADREGHPRGWPFRVCTGHQQRKSSMPTTTTTKTASSHPTPLQAIRQTCLGCVDGSPEEVRSCPPKPCSDGMICPLWEHRSGRKRKKPKTKPLKSIRQHCLWCMGGSYLLVKDCASGPGSEHPCPVWDYRLGKG